jgi:[ribosomal protein S5]-alanine N-acetyltransferase
VTAVIATERLDLVTLPPGVLRLIDGGHIAELERTLGTPVPAGWTDGVPAALRLAQLAADPSEEPWLVRAMVLRTPRRLVGSIGFHQPPDASGRAEIGYDVVATKRRQRYAREAIHGLTAWAFATGRAHVCVASITPDNAASLSLVRSLGFVHVGEQIDEVDGLELVFERRLPLDGAGITTVSFP